MPSKVRLGVLIAGSSLAAVGYGIVLPFLYADVADVRGMGSLTASSLFIWFAIGSLAAAPLAGRWADRHDPALVSTLARLSIGVSLLGLAFAPSAPWLWCAALLYGAAGSVTWPSIQVLVLAWTGEQSRRDAFAWQFISVNLAIAVGGMVGGVIVDLSSVAGTRPLYYVAVVAEIMSAAVVWSVARNGRVGRDELTETPAGGHVREMLKAPGVRLLLAMTFVLSLVFYAQYESGLPTFAYRALEISPKTVGAAIAVNAILVAVLTGPVVAVTRHRDPISLLLACVVVWAGCWAVLGAALVDVFPPAGSLVFGYALFAVGEAMLSPVLTPLAASLAPPGAIGRTLSAVSASRTLAGAIGPALSGVLLALGVPGVFVGLQLAFCLASAALLSRLRRHAPHHERVLVHPR